MYNHHRRYSPLNAVIRAWVLVVLVFFAGSSAQAQLNLYDPDLNPDGRKETPLDFSVVSEANRPYFEAYWELLPKGANISYRGQLEKMDRALTKFRATDPTGAKEPYYLLVLGLGGDQTPQYMIRLMIRHIPNSTLVNDFVLLKQLCYEGDRRGLERTNTNFGGRCGGFAMYIQHRAEDETDPLLRSQLATLAFNFAWDAVILADRKSSIRTALRAAELGRQIPPEQRPWPITDQDLADIHIAKALHQSNSLPPTTGDAALDAEIARKIRGLMSGPGGQPLPTPVDATGQLDPGLREELIERFREQGRPLGTESGTAPQGS